MSTLVESLKRLYLKGSVTVGKLDTILADGKITQEEYSYIIAEV
jgi:hypothetical protein